VIGQALDGRYVLTRQIGEGGMGVVYEAQHSATGRRVAVKLITAAVDPGGEHLGRFQREARAAGSIDTQHIAHVYDVGADPGTGRPFMVMELLTGEDLWAVTKRHGTLTVDVVLRIAAQALIGLQKAHEARVIHRDIKPANLFLARREDGEIVVKILDFGIAKIARGSLEEGGDTTHLTNTGSILGTPHYMAPEQAKGLRTIDHRADIWSMGAVLYRVLSGRTPHAHVDTVGQLIVAICTEDPTPIQEVAPWVPPEVAAVVHRALQRAPEARFPSAKAMLDAIRLLLPNGIAIQETMLASPGPSQQGYAAPRPPQSGSTITGVSFGSDDLLRGAPAAAPQSSPLQPVSQPIPQPIQPMAPMQFTLPTPPPHGASAPPRPAGADRADLGQSGMNVYNAPLSGDLAGGGGETWRMPGAPPQRPGRTTVPMLGDGRPSGPPPVPVYREPLPSSAMAPGDMRPSMVSAAPAMPSQKSGAILAITASLATLAVGALALSFILYQRSSAAPPASDAMPAAVTVAPPESPAPPGPPAASAPSMAGQSPIVFAVGPAEAPVSSAGATSAPASPSASASAKPAATPKATSGPPPVPPTRKPPRPSPTKAESPGVWDRQ
jgi:serine/threonine-protein kinase